MLAACASYAVAKPGAPVRPPLEIKVPDNLPVERVDFEAKGVEVWALVAGQWTVEAMEGAPSGRRVLVQRATRNAYNVIVAPFGPYTDVDVSMKFKPISGREDASGGIVFRFADGKYYVVRANALEDNVRLYSYDRDRRQLATASVKAPALGQWHTVRVVAVGITCRPGSTAPGTSITAIRGSRRDAWDCGRRRIRSRRSMTSPFVG